MIKPTVVLGVSLKPSRYSHLAVHRLKKYNHPVLAIGLRSGEVAGEEVITFNDAFAKAETHKNKFDTVTLYLNPKRQDQYIPYLISLNPKRVIFNPGTENPELYRILKENNIDFEVACTLVLLGTNQY
ncbi:CoA-binding protein [Dokdonia sp.]|uniref:CoA-binding protein n=1 Tax=Dokdonia sp. TaxID=2024995 RepID=UPI00326706B1